MAKVRVFEVGIWRTFCIIWNQGTIIPPMCLTTMVSLNNSSKLMKMENIALNHRLPQELLQYTHISQNDFSYRKHKKQKEEDIAVCTCKYNANIPDSACGERCLNVLTSSECTPGYCPCGVYCKNQKFQKCEYAKTKLFQTDGRGWGVVADEKIKAGCFIIEYCGEVISWREAKRRSEIYESLGLKDSFIISLNSHESIDATQKGSLARFINHSCQPNCETRKWTVLGEVRVGIFAKECISVGAELAYDYNFEWYGGAKVRCLCGATTCSGFLGAKSRGFQEDTHVWEEDDDRYRVEEIPLYDSAEDEPLGKIPNTANNSKSKFMTDWKIEYSMMDDRVGSGHEFEPTAAVVESLDSVPMEGAIVNVVKREVNEETKKVYPHRNGMISCQSYHIGPGHVSRKRPQLYIPGRPKQLAQTQVDTKLVSQLLSSKNAREEVMKCEETKNQATSRLKSLYDEIRPAIEEHERDSQDSVPTSVADKWIKACCFKLKAEFDLYSSSIRNLACSSSRARTELELPPRAGDNEPE